MVGCVAFGKLFDCVVSGAREFIMDLSPLPVDHHIITNCVTAI